MNQEEICQAIAKAADDKKANSIVIMDMRGLMSSTDYFVISSANTATQTRAIADNIEEELEKQGIALGHKEGAREGEWILLDYGDVVAHVFKEDAREYYSLERLWNDAHLTPYNSAH